MELPTTGEMTLLRVLGGEYYIARERIEKEYFDFALDPATYTENGVLDWEAYAATLNEILEFVESGTSQIRWNAPTESEPYNVASQPIFGYLEFECRRRLTAVLKYEQATLT